MHWVLIATAAGLGLLFGSFLNVVIYRGPAIWGLVESDQSRGGLAFPSSRCPACRTPIRALHLIPIIGFLLLRGRCATCGAAISWRYPAIELLGGAAAVSAVVIYGFSVAALAAAVFLLCLIALAAIDLETGYLPDAITLPLIAAGLGVNVALVFAPFPAAVIGAAVGYGAFAGVAFVFRKLRGVEGLGLGDAKLLAAIGAWLGWAALPAVVFAGSLFGLAAVGALHLAGRPVGRETPIPFGPALCLAAAILLLATGAGFGPAAMFSGP